jgi:hypothetical protein
LPTYKERVIADGILRGDGHDAEAHCRVSATKVSLGTGEFTYSKYHLESISKPVPEGNYHLFALGSVLPVRYQGGILLWGGAP